MKQKLGGSRGIIEQLEGPLSGESFPVYAADGERVLENDGAGLDLFGVVSYSVHMLGWVTAKDGSKRYWVP